QPGEEKQLNRHALILGFSSQLLAGQATNAARVDKSPHCVNLRRFQLCDQSLIDTGLSTSKRRISTMAISCA
ncbi:hypothetical protein, partial [Casimicrobium huifangae]|uniref:hypothetical protein n=1 Tax=Casimicrobium huifangae TaxID=2591109 RepID=UPI0037839888